MPHFALIMTAVVFWAFGCTKDSTGSQGKTSCDWHVLESFPEQIRGTCQFDTSLEQLEIPMTSLPPAIATLVVEVNGKILEKTSYTYDDTGKKLVVSQLGEDMHSGTIKISYTADRNITVTGIVEDAQNLDGCSFLIKLDSGSYLQPINLDAAFKAQGTKVKLSYREQPDRASACMRGKIVEIVSISKN